METHIVTKFSQLTLKIRYGHDTVSAVLHILGEEECKGTEADVRFTPAQGSVENVGVLVLGIPGVHRQKGFGVRKQFVVEAQVPDTAF